MVEHKFSSVYGTDTTKPLKTKEIRFTLFSTVAQLLEYGEIKYSRILLDLERGDKVLLAWKTRYIVQDSLKVKVFKIFIEKKLTVSFYSFITTVRL